MAKKQRQSKKTRGGSACNGAAAYAEQVYGDSNSQHATAGGNVIAMNVVKGGKKKSNNVFTNMKSATMRLLRKARKSVSRKSRRIRHSRRRY
jgi:hypothetical protein